MHGVFKQFLIVFTSLPAIFRHAPAILVQTVRVVRLGIHIREFPALGGCEFFDLIGDRTRQPAGLSEYHIPDRIREDLPAILAFLHGNHIEESQVLDILRERGNERRITDLGPDIGHLVEELDHQLVGRQFRLTVLDFPFIERSHVVLEVGHQRAHHAAGQAGLDQQGIVQAVVFRAVIAQEIVVHLLNQAAGFHIGIHVDVLDDETGIPQHLLHGDHVGMARTPGEGRHGRVDIVATVLAHFQDGSHAEARTRMRMILDRNLRIGILDTLDDLAQGDGTADAGHVFETDLIRAGLDELLRQADEILRRMDRGVCQAKGSLGDHAGRLCISDGRDDVARIVQPVENAGDIRPLRLLDLVEQLPQVLGTGTHPHGVQPPVQHVRLDAGLVERLRPLTHGDVGVLPVQQIHLLKSAAVGLDAVETAHPDDGWGYFHELVHARLILTRALPHIPEYQAQFDFSCHSL